MSSDETPESLLRDYLDLVEMLGGRSPSLSELVTNGISRSKIRHRFGTRAALDELARSSRPDLFVDTPISMAPVAEAKARTFIITCPVVGARTHLGFCKALRALADRRGAELIALPVADPASRATPNGEGRIDNALLELGFKVVQGDVEVNENLVILGIQISAKQLQPTTGLLRFGQRGQSLIIPAPKRFLKFVATNGKLPHAVMTPGACTVANYITDQHRSKRTAYLAEQDHLLAAIIVEVEDDKRFHFRQLTWSEEYGNVVDMGEDHNGDPFPFLAVQPGDWHSGVTHPYNRRFVMGNTLQAKHIFVHDSFDGQSVNNHATRFEQLSDPKPLLHELISWGEDLLAMADVYERVYVVHSNHDDRIRRWLQSMQHASDPVNFRVGRQLESYLLEGQNPLRQWFLDRHKDKGAALDRIFFLGPNASHRIGGVEMACHGHLGSNGSRRPSLRSFEESIGPCCIGHSHTPGIWREVWQAGTSTYLRLDYTKGPSSWFWSHIGVYEDGRRQMINILPEEDQCQG